MRLSHLYILISILLISPNILSQERDWNNTSEIYERLDFHRDRLNEDSSIFYADEMIRFHKEKLNLNGVAGAIFTKLVTLDLYNRKEEAFQLALKAYNQYCKVPETDRNCSTCKHITAELVKLITVLQDYRQGIYYLDQNCASQKDGKYYYQKAKLYVLLELPDSALLMTATAIDLAKKKGKLNDLIGTYNQQGLIADNLNRFDDAIAAYTNAIKIIEENNKEIANYAFIMGNLGNSYYKKGEYAKAYECLLIDSKGSEPSTQKMSFINAELLLAQIDTTRKDYKSLIKRVQNLRSNYPIYLSDENELAAIEMLMHAYKEIGQKSKYQLYSSKWVSLSKSYFQAQMKMQKNMGEQNSTHSLQQVTEKMKLEKQLQNQVIITQQNNAEKKRIELIALILAFSLSIGIISFLFWKYKATQTKKSIIKEAELRFAKKEQEVLTLKIKEESKNVQALSLELTTKQGFSEGLIQELDKLSSISKPELKGIEIYIQNELDVKSTRAHLQTQMGELSGAFYNNLLIKHNTLSDSDLKLAAMITIGMSNKEIGISKNISTESVKKTKHRLKKKLHLAQEISLTDYLKALI